MVEPVKPCRALWLAALAVCLTILGCATPPPPAPPPLPNNNALTELGRAQQAEATGDWASAREHLAESVKESPELGLAQVDLADVLMHLGDEGPALQAALAAGKRLEPQNPRLWKLAGAYDEDNGDAAGALLADERALSLRPGDAKVEFRLAGLYAGANRNVQAVSAYRTVLALDPTNAQAQLSLAGLLEAQGDLGGADAQLTALCARSPHNALYQAQLEQVQVKEGKAAPERLDTRVMRPLRRSRH